MGFITIYGDTSCDMTRDHPKTPGKHNFNENRPPCCGLRFALAPCLCLPLALSPAGPFWSSFCCPSDGHIMGLTVPPVKINLVPHDSACYLSAWLFLFRFPVLIISLFFSFLPFISHVSVSRYPKHFLGIDIDTYRKHKNIARQTEKSRHDTE